MNAVAVVGMGHIGALHNVDRSGDHNVAADIQH